MDTGGLFQETKNQGRGKSTWEHLYVDRERKGHEKSDEFIVSFYLYQHLAEGFIQSDVQMRMLTYMSSGVYTFPLPASTRK